MAKETAWIEVNCIKRPRTRDWFVTINPPNTSDGQGNFAAQTIYLTVSQARVLAKRLNNVTLGK